MPANDNPKSPDALSELHRQQIQEAIKRIRENAIKNGTATMSMDDIDAVIADYRRERRAKREAAAKEIEERNPR